MFVWLPLSGAKHPFLMDLILFHGADQCWLHFLLDLTSSRELGVTHWRSQSRLEHGKHLRVSEHVQG